MKNNKFRIYCLLLTLTTLSGLHAQNTIATSGGVATGAGGSISYTLGQVLYKTHTASDTKSISEGVQQPYEVSQILSIETNIKLNVSVFPNPTTNYLTLKINEESFYTRWPYGLMIEILDINGRLLIREKMKKSTIILNIEDFDEATYFLNIMNVRTTIKSFKIVKGS